MEEAWKRIVEDTSWATWRVLPRGLLRLASFGYGIGVWFRNALFDLGWKRVDKAHVPVICIGNLTVGGTGKTPCVEYVADFFRESKQVAILSRGYGGDGGPNDEAMLLEQNLPDVPHLQGRDRVELAKTAVEELESELLILDDGYQHRRLGRDLDICLFDATQKAIHLFPRGYLREPLSALKRTDFLILTHADRVLPAERDALLKRLLRQYLPCALAKHEPAEWQCEGGEFLEPDAFAGREAIGFCGLGKPESFRRTLDDLGVKLLDFKTFPDHHNYTREDVGALRQWANRFPQGTPVLTTQKDFVKLRLPDLADRELWSLRIRMSFMEGEERFQEMLQRLG